MRNCAECNTVFMAKHSLEFVCPSCSPYCKGCGSKHSPSNKNETLCARCLKDIGEGICTHCRTAHHPVTRSTFDRVGHCEDCRHEKQHFAMIDNTIDHRWCSKCIEPITDERRNYCNTCSLLTDVCPYCSIHEKSVTEYACNICKIEYMKLGKKFKEQQ